MNSPTPEAVRDARTTAGLTQSEAAAVVYVTLRAWQHWEDGQRQMHPAFWELFCLKAGVSPAATRVSRARPT